MSLILFELIWSGIATLMSILPSLSFRKTLRFCLFAFWMAGNFTAATAQPRIPVAIDSLLQQAIIATVNQDYDRALVKVDTVIARDPEQPIGYLFRAATLQSRMLDYENDADEEEFLRSLKNCRQLSEKTLHKNPGDVYAHFWLGSAYGYESFYVGKKRKYLEAVHTAWKTIQHLETAIQLDPEMYDAYLGIGTYKYYRSKLKLLFWGDERAEGLAMVRQAVAHGKYSQYAAVNGLAWMLLDENLPGEAFALTDSILQQFPRSRFFLWAKAESAARLENYEQARACYQQIMSSLLAEHKLSPYLNAVCRSKMARLALQESRPSEACAQLDLIDEQNLPRETQGREMSKKIAQLRKSCLEATAAASNSRHGGQ